MRSSFIIPGIILRFLLAAGISGTIVDAETSLLLSDAKIEIYQQQREVHSSSQHKMGINLSFCQRHVVSRIRS